MLIIQQKVLRQAWQKSLDKRQFYVFFYYSIEIPPRKHISLTPILLGNSEMNNRSISKRIFDIIIE